MTATDCLCVDSAVSNVRSLPFLPLENADKIVSYSFILCLVLPVALPRHLHHRAGSLVSP